MAGSNFAEQAIHNGGCLCGAVRYQVRGAHSLGWNVLGMPQLEAQSFPQRQRRVNGFDRYRHVTQPCLFTHVA